MRFFLLLFATTHFDCISGSQTNYIFSELQIKTDLISTVKIYRKIKLPECLNHGNEIEISCGFAYNVGF